MKKRVLSVLLALTLCFTMFAGMALAAPNGRVERNINRTDNVLNNVAIDAQREIIEGVVDTVGEKLDASIVDELVWKPGTPAEKENGVPYLITEPMLRKADSLEDNETLSYFVLLQLSEEFTADDAEKYPKVAELVAQFNDIDAQYDTAGEPLSESLKKFDDYGDALTALYTSFMEDDDAQIELFSYSGILEDVMKDAEIPQEYSQEEIEQYITEQAKAIYKEDPSKTYPEIFEEASKRAEEHFPGVKVEAQVDEKAALDALMTKGQEYAYTSICDIVADVIPDAFQGAVDNYDYEEGNGLYLEAFRELMNNDSYKKQAAIVIGKDLMKLASTGAFGTVSSYARDRKNDVQELAVSHKTQLLSADREDIYNAFYKDFANTIIGWLEDDAKNGNPDLSESVQTKITDLVTELEKRGLSLSGLQETMTYLMGELDPNKDFQNIWYNLGLNRLMVEDGLMITGSDVTDDGKGSFVDLDITLSHRLIDNQFKDPDKAFDFSNCANNFYLAFAENNAQELNDMKLLQDASGTRIIYDADTTSRPVKLNVYRGGYKNEEEKDTTVPDGTFDVERYVATVTIELPAYTEEPPVPVAEPLTVEEFAGTDITVENGTPWADVETQLVKTVTLKTAEGVAEEAKREVTADVTWTMPVGYDVLASQPEGYTIPLDGTYVVPNEDPAPAGDVDGKVQVTLTIKPKTETVTGSITIDNKDELERGTGYKAGDTVKVESTVKDIELVVIAIAKKGEPINGQNGLLYQTLTADQAHSFEFKLPADIQPGRYIVVVGNDQAGASDKSYFDVVASELNYEVFPLDGGKAYAYNVKRGTAWEDISDVIAGRFDQVGFKITKDGSLVGPQLDITWDLTKFNANKSGDQTVNGTYDLNELYAAGYTAENIGKDIDGKVSVTICRHDEDYHSRSHNNGIGGPSYDTTYFTDGTEYDGSKTIHLVGETTNTRVVIDLVGPDGKVLKSVTLARTDFLQGYDWDIADIAPLAPGIYLLQLKSTSGSLYDERKFTVNDLGQVITSDIFNKDDHFNYILGFDDGTVRPEAYITRDEVAAIMFRLLKDDVRNKNLTETTDKFTDIPEGHWSMTAFATLNTLGIYEGRGNGIMGCGDDITRAEFAALCSRFAVESATGLTSVYTDIAGNWAEKEIMAVTAAGWFQGDDNLFRPDDKITRAEVVTVMNRILGRDSLNASAFGNEDTNKYSDLSPDKWYYIPMVEATTAHDYEYVDGMEVWKSTDASIDWTVYE